MIAIAPGISYTTLSGKIHPSISMNSPRIYIFGSRNPLRAKAPKAIVKNNNNKKTCNTNPK